MNATNAPFVYGSDLETEGSCGLTIKIKVIDGTEADYPTTCTQIIVVSDVWDYGLYLKMPLALLLTTAVLLISV